MKRIDTDGWFNQTIPQMLYDIADGINETMNYLEKNIPAKNGKFWKCTNCGHVTAYVGSCPCGNAHWEIFDE